MLFTVNIHHQASNLPLSKFDVDNKENDPKQETNSSHCDVGNTKEVIFATQEAGCGENHSLLATEWIHWVIVVNLQIVTIL